jgi:hypothetical protein
MRSAPRQRDSFSIPFIFSGIKRLRVISIRVWRDALRG